MAVGATLRTLGVNTLLALTATATERTATSILSTLALPADAVRRHAIHRPNLQLCAELVESNQRLGRVRSLLASQLARGASAIVYCNYKYEVDETVRDLQSRGWKCDGYHSGRPQLEKQQVQAAFMSNQLQVVVATVAFGMGVHKADVRLVVHSGLPRSIETWVQETGRAGRDGLPATCVALVGEEDYRRLHSQCHRDGVEHEQVEKMLASLLRNARNGYGELAHQHLEAKLDMSHEVAQTALAMLAELPASAWEARAAPEAPKAAEAAEDAEGEEGLAGVGRGEGVAATSAAQPAGHRGPPSGHVELLPDIRRTATLRFHHDPPEVVASRSPLVGMLLKYAKQVNGAYKCPLVQAASELGLDAHAAHEQLCSLHSGSILSLELTDGAFYLAIRKVPLPAELRTLTAELLRRMQHVEQLARTKLDACATLLWALAEAGASASASAAPSSDALLARYFEDGALDEEGWAAPFRRRALPLTLRGDVLEFVATHAAESGKAGVALTGRAVARILHRLHSPSFPKKDWEKNKFWGMHRDVDFDVLRRLADEHLETWSRKLRQHSMAVNLKHNKAKRMKGAEK